MRSTDDFIFIYWKKEADRLFRIIRRFERMRIFNQMTPAAWRLYEIVKDRLFEITSPAYITNAVNDANAT